MRYFYILNLFRNIKRIVVSPARRLKRKRVSIYYFSTSILFILLLFNCSDHSAAKKLNIPPGATFNKKMNLYQLSANGIQRQWNNEGKLYSECQLNEKGLLNGECKMYSQVSGELISKGFYKNNLKDGEWIWNFPDGKIYYKLNYAFNKKRAYWIDTNLIGNEHGLYERYYDNGVLEEKGFFDSGFKIGDWEKFYRSGKQEYKGSFNKDKKIGDWVYYFPDGKTEIEEKFNDDGILIFRKTYYPDGKLACEIKEGKTSCNE